MREILFRGKDAEGKWVEGYFLKTQSGTYIMYDGWWDDDLFVSPKNIIHAVDPDTVGQFTGLTDKNSKKIFEGDICRVEYLLLKNLIPYGYQVDYTKCGVVAYVQDKFVLVKDGHWNAFDNTEVTVLGNIHDNPELLEEAKAIVWQTPDPNWERITKFNGIPLDDDCPDCGAKMDK